MEPIISLKSRKLVVRAADLMMYITFLKKINMRMRITETLPNIIEMTPDTLIDRLAFGQTLSKT